MIDRDMIAHLEANGFRVIECARVRKLSIQQAMDLGPFHYAKDDFVFSIKNRMSYELGTELMEQAGWSVTDKAGVRIFKTEVEVIL